MAADHAVDKRTRLLASKTKWSEMDDIAASQPLISPNAAQHLRKTGSSEDDLALGVEASLYGKPTIRTVQGFFRTSLASPPLTSAWDSLTSGISTQSGPLSVMDVLHLWQDDPEELLLDLGFGAEEPDITVRIPARFINHQSQARGININLFLEAQKNRIDIENPDVRNRFRQIEVLQQVTTAFSSLVGGEKPVESPVSEETREKRKRIGMLFRKASKKSLSQLANSRDQQPLSPSLAGQSFSPELPGDPPLDKRISLKRASLSPLVEEQISVLEAAEPTETITLPQVKSSSPRAGRELKNVTSTAASTQRGPGEPTESFELEEIQSFDEGSIGGSCTGTLDHSGNERTCLSRVSSCMVRTNSCQSDSSGFLEEPFIPAHPSPGPELMKVLNAMSGDSTESLQKSVDQQETELHSPYPQDSDTLLKQTESSATDSNTDTAQGLAHTKLLISKGGTAKNNLQDTNRTDCLVNMDVMRKDIVGDYVGESPTLQKDSLGLHDYGANVGQSATLQKDLPRLCDYGANIGQSTTLQKDSPRLCDYGANIEQSTTLQKDSPGLCNYGTNIRESTTLQKDSPRLCDYGANIGQSTTLQKDSPRLCDYGANIGQSTKLQKDSLNPPHDVILEGDSQMEILKSDETVFNIDSSPTDPEAGGTENKVSSSTERYSGHSVSVQMCSNLASQSSRRGSMSHSPSIAHIPTSDVQLRREPYLRREQSDADVENISDPAPSANTPTTNKHPSPDPWRSQECSKGLRSLEPHSTSLDRGLSYEEDTRWKAALWAGAQCCGSCGHKRPCCCQSKNSKKQYSGSLEQLHTASSLPYSMEEIMGMMRCMWKFRKMLAEIEERLEEEQETVNSSFSDEHRAEVQDILELRTAVKKEAEILEQQVNDLVQAYDDNMKMKMNRLLDEQSHLCTQLRFTPCYTPHPSNISKKSVGIQCTLLTDSPESRLSSQLTDNTRLIHDSEWSPSNKADKLDFVGFIKSLKDVSISHDSLE